LAEPRCEEWCCVPEILPMFPLGTVLLPGMVLPLHVFEPRYRQLVADVLADDGRFGVVLIERGHEVGGNDSRTSVGTVAEVVRAEELDDGRWVLVAIGTDRIRVDQWLDGAPYPCAEVTTWPDADTRVEPDLLAEVGRKLQRVLALADELGEDVPEVDLDAEPLTASFQAVILSPLGPQDSQHLLVQPDAQERLARLADLLDDQEEVLQFRLGDSTR
jgi:Lon protease-like protein